MRYGTVGAGPSPHYDMTFHVKRAGDLDMIAKAGASGVINNLITADTQVVLLLVRVFETWRQGLGVFEILVLLDVAGREFRFSRRGLTGRRR